MNRLLVPKAFGITFTAVAVTTFYSVRVCPLQASVPFYCLKWLLLPPSVSPSPSSPACLASWPLWCWRCFLPLCCWLWLVLLLGLSEQAQQSLFSLIWCLAHSPSVLHQLGIGDVNTTPLAASSTDISSCAKHVSVTPKFSMPVIVASPDTAQAESGKSWQKYSIVFKERLIVPLIKLLLANNTSVQRETSGALYNHLSLLCLSLSRYLCALFL